MTRVTNLHRITLNRNEWIDSNFFKTKKDNHRFFENAKNDDGNSFAQVNAKMIIMFDTQELPDDFLKGLFGKMGCLKLSFLSCEHSESEVFKRYNLTTYLVDYHCLVYMDTYISYMDTYMFDSTLYYNVAQVS